MRILIAALCLVFAGTANAIYKCKNPDGSISFSDAPCGVRDEGVDIEKEQRYQEELERRRGAEEEELALQKRERRARLIEVRKRKDNFARQYHRSIEENAWPHYTEEAFPELASRYYERMIDIEQYRFKAVPLVLNSQQCDLVTACDLDESLSTPEQVHILVRCANGQQFRLTETEIEDGLTPTASD